MFGNVNVDYKPCKSKVQLERAANYILGKLPEQISEGVIKTVPNLYWGMNCDRDNFARDVLMTRELFGKRKSKNANLAYKMSISFHPDDNDKFTYDEVFRIAKEFAEKYFQGYEVLFAVHTDKPHKHVHFLVGNCHIETGKAYRRNHKDLYDMCEFFGEQCMKRGLFHSIREDFYNHDNDYNRETFAERQMKAKGKETFKDELREVIQIELSDPNNQTLEDVVNALMKHYNVECRVKGNTISYCHPNFTDKSGKLASVRGSKLGEKYTVKGIEHELREKQRGRSADRTEGVLLTGKAETRCTADSQPVESRIYIKATGSGGTSRNTAARIGSDQSDDTGSGTAVGCNIGGIQEGRASALARSSDTSNVPTLEELFSSYQRRNRENSRKRTPEPEHTETVRRKRKGIDR